jgi:hypothetical protein
MGKSVAAVAATKEVAVESVFCECTNDVNCVLCVEDLMDEKKIKIPGAPKEMEELFKTAREGNISRLVDPLRRVRRLCRSKKVRFKNNGMSKAQFGEVVGFFQKT